MKPSAASIIFEHADKIAKLAFAFFVIFLSLYFTQKTYYEIREKREIIKRYELMTEKEKTKYIEAGYIRGFNDFMGRYVTTENFDAAIKIAVTDCLKETK